MSTLCEGTFSEVSEVENFDSIVGIFEPCPID
jgi:hypothetical protein